jgi:hypothetical protein
MTTKREADELEQAIRSLSEREYGRLIAWLSNGGEGPLWPVLRRVVMRGGDVA